jgi:hypothetical protein
VDTLLPLRRGLGPLTAILALLTIWALWSTSWVSGPLAVLFVVAAFCWSMSRFEQPGRGRAVEVACGGCAAGCVGCREHIDLPESA